VKVWPESGPAPLVRVVSLSVLLFSLLWLHQELRTWNPGATFLRAVLTTVGAKTQAFRPDIATAAGKMMPAAPHGAPPKHQVAHIFM
jgi:hypothetical protein